MFSSSTGREYQPNSPIEDCQDGYGVSGAADYGSQSWVLYMLCLTQREGKKDDNAYE